jgi:hypothetical protein
MSLWESFESLHLSIPNQIRAIEFLQYYQVIDIPTICLVGKSGDCKKCNFVIKCKPYNTLNNNDNSNSTYHPFVIKPEKDNNKYTFYYYTHSYD